MNERPSKIALGGSNGLKFFIIFGFIVVVLLVIATITSMLFTQAPSKVSVGDDCRDETGKAAVTVTYTKGEQFDPQCLKISSGTKVTYENNSASELEIGADPHPVHTGNREVSNDEFKLSVQPGKTASTTMKKKGTFGLHNHLRSSTMAQIQVQ